MTLQWSFSNPSRHTPAGQATLSVYGRAYVKAIGEG
jgi:hypothetical protein